MQLSKKAKVRRAVWYWYNVELSLKSKHWGVFQSLNDGYFFGQLCMVDTFTFENKKCGKITNI